MKKITELATANIVNADDLFLTTQGYSNPGTGVSRKVTLAQLRSAARFDGAINVRDYGAIGDGLADDTLAIQAALDAIPPNGGIVLFSAGSVFKFSAPLNVLSNTTLTGGGILKAAPMAQWLGGSPYRGITNKNESATVVIDANIVLDNIIVDYTGFGGSDGTDHCIRFQRVDGVIIRNCTIKGGSSSVALLGCTRSLEQGNIYLNFYNCGSDHWDSPKNVKVIGCHIETQNASQMFNFNPEPSTLVGTGLVADGFVFDDNVCISHEPSSTASQVEALAAGNTVKNVTITNNIFKNCYVAARGDVRGANISGNTFSDLQSHASAIVCTDQFATAGKGIVISGNVIRDPLTSSPAAGVIDLQTDEGQVSGNVITGTAYTSVPIYTQDYRPNVYGNRIEKEPFPGYLQGGFRLLNGDTNFIGWYDNAGNSSRMHLDASNAWRFFTRNGTGGQRTVLQMNARSDTSALRCEVPMGMGGLFYPLHEAGLVATGTNSTTALVLTAQVNEIDTVAPGTGVRVVGSVSFYGLETTVANGGANPLKVYPPTTAQFDGLAINIPVILPPGAVGVWQNTDTDVWRTKSITAPLIDGKLNVRLFGAMGDGVTDDRAAIQAAINAANALTYGGVVYFPPGRYRIDTSGGGLIAKSNVILSGAGPALATIWKDDSIADTSGVLHNITTFPEYTVVTHFRIENLGFAGRADVLKTQSAGQLVSLSADDLQIHNCWFTNSRFMGVVVQKCRRAVITNCRVNRTIADGIAAWNCSDLIITNNECYQVNDDAISAHSDDAYPTPVRGGILIANNQITESQGIAVLGGKSVTITDNVLRRIMGIGIRVMASGATSQGQTAQFACRISNNSITDVILRSEPSPRTGGHYGILVAGGIRRNGAGASPPGEPVSGTGAVTSLYGTTGGVGTLYLNETGAGGSPAPAGYAIDIVDNVVIRSLPAVTNISEWGYGSSGLWVGNNGDGTGFYNGAITDTALRFVPIAVDPAMWECRIARNVLRSGGLYGIYFRTNETVVHGDFRGLNIENNKITDFSTAGIQMPTPVSIHRMIVRNNELDADPHFRHANRGAGGTWLAATAPYGIYAQTSGGMFIEGNHFRNMAITVQYPGDASTFTSTKDNYQYGTAAALNFSTLNKGVGSMTPNGVTGWTTVPEDSDPTSATYGRIISEVERVRSTAAGMPITGYYTRGHVVWNNNPTPASGKVLLGWFRITTGNAHLAGTDWTPVYGTIT